MTNRHESEVALEERVTELEVRIAYQDRVIADLDAVVREFAGRVEQLERQLDAAIEAAEKKPES